MNRITCLTFVGWFAACDFSGRAELVDATPPDGARHDGMPDAPASPADAFDLAACGTSYSITIGASRYRVEQTATAAWTAHDLCAADVAGATHLAVLDTVDERDSVQGTINFQVAGTNRFWIGGVQKHDATQIGDDWLAVTGGPMLANAWSTNEPTDNDGAPPYTTEIHAEQFVRLNRNGLGLIDAPGSTISTGYVCECDGKPIDAVAAMAVTDSTGI